MVGVAICGNQTPKMLAGLASDPGVGKARFFQDLGGSTTNWQGFVEQSAPTDGNFRLKRHRFSALSHAGHQIQCLQEGLSVRCWDGLVGVSTEILQESWGWVCKVGTQEVEIAGLRNATAIYKVFLAGLLVMFANIWYF